jgi:hypothetical protein|eukprot:COSAG01_NODE_1771_length_9270_cov_5.316868_3_plen_143_part_00
MPDVMPTYRPRVPSLRGQKHLLYQHLHHHSPPPELGGRKKGRGRRAYRHVPPPPQAVSHLKQPAHKVVSAGLSVGSTAGIIQMVLHKRNVKELSSPRGQPHRANQAETEYEKTRKGGGDGADERRSAATPKVKAAPFPALIT